uniref:flagellar motor protein MotB n=1 Tax=uncultured Roseibium sp. TaxID=1936171 RepID=UPI0032165D5A
MQDTLPNEIVIVRRRPDWEGEAHGHGVWKIAYADFMTAMMAFFLVMWLINVTDDSVKSGVAQYFNPVKLASTAPNKKGLNDPNVAGTTNEDGANLPEGDLNAGNGRKDGVDIRKGVAPEASERSAGETMGEFTQTHSEAQLFADPYAV